MSRTLIITIAAIGLGVGSTLAASGAFAGESRHAARSGPELAQSEAIQAGLRDLGYRVSHVEAEHNRLEMRVTNEVNIPAKLTYDARTGELLRAALR
jgi:hypothetical protein